MIFLASGGYKAVLNNVDYHLVLTDIFLIQFFNALPIFF